MATTMPTLAVAPRFEGAVETLRSLPRRAADGGSVGGGGVSETILRFDANQEWSGCCSRSLNPSVPGTFSAGGSRLLGASEPPQEPRYPFAQRAPERQIRVHVEQEPPLAGNRAPQRLQDGHGTLDPTQDTRQNAPRRRLALAVRFDWCGRSLSTTWGGGLQGRATASGPTRSSNRAASSRPDMHSTPLGQTDNQLLKRNHTLASTVTKIASTKIPSRRSTVAASMRSEDAPAISPNPRPPACPAADAGT